MSFCAITPTRGDRPQFLDFCKHQVSRMAVKPDEHIIVDYKPESVKVDLTQRIRVGIELALKNGHEYAFILEDDDWYNPAYLEQMIKAMKSGAEFIGHQTTTYYNIFTHQYQSWDHAGRASLFMTGFKLSALDNFKWPVDETVFFDIILWSHAQKEKLKIHYTDKPLALGIKHGIGRTGGKGHVIKMRNHDRHFSYLIKTVGKEDFQFYITMERKQ